MSRRKLKRRQRDETRCFSCGAGTTADERRCSRNMNVPWCCHMCSHAVLTFLCHFQVILNLKRLTEIVQEGWMSVWGEA